ncbi:hypothetical protein, partial [Cognatilysobacter lacus]|uniref:hypothetical protein n=1 Tax=Cognatilysobacter lacus TaxID=1643323 RepID=UPI0019619616
MAKPDADERHDNGRDASAMRDAAREPGRKLEELVCNKSIQAPDCFPVWALTPELSRAAKRRRL